MMYSMVAVSRRRRFIFLVAICCVSFFAFGWYASKDVKSTNEIYVTDLGELLESFSESTEPATSIESYNKPASSALEAEPVDADAENAFLKKINDLSKKAAQQNNPVSDLDLVSGPTEEDSSFAVTRESTFEVSTDAESIKPSEEATTAASEQEVTPSKERIDSQGSPEWIVEHVAEEEATTPGTLGITEADKSTKNPSLIVDTSGCKIPKMDPWDPSVAHLITTDGPIICSGKPLFMNPAPDGSITLNETILKKSYNLTKKSLVCFYQVIQREHEKPGNVRENAYTLLDARPMKFGIPLKADYVVVKCELEPNKTFEQYFALVRIKKDLEKQRSSLNVPDPQLNVILAGIDSVSKLNFLRHFKKTREFLKNKMNPFEMKGYTKVGDNTFPNLIPMLTGHFVEHYWNETIRDTYYFDDVDHIWKAYAKRGFRTFYAEDSPWTGTFNYIKRGFYDPPTDYYMRPTQLALEASNIRKISDSHCFHSQLETDIIYDYLHDFVTAMKKRPYIAFAMVSTITHDYFNNAAYADDPTFRILERLWDHGHLNNSVLVLFSDHGIRFGKIRETYIGKIEERMPFMYVHFPRWFLEKYPEYARNLQTNQERLMTLFDIHATMIHLLDLGKVFTEEDKETLTRGSSLLNEIPDSRTCDDANILVHWCPCATYDPVPTNDTTAVKSAQAIVDEINSRLEPHKPLCAVLEINQISDARFGQTSELIQRFQRHENDVINRTVVLGEKAPTIGDYLITLTTKPGLAVFEGTVRVDTSSHTYTVLGISRINMYGNQSVCIDSQKLKIFCYCNS